MSIGRMIEQLLEEEKSPKKSDLKEKLLYEFSGAEIVGELAANYNEDSAICFDCICSEKPKKIKEIKTVGTFYYRIYNGGTEKVVSLLIKLWIDMGYNVVLFTDESVCEKDYMIPRQTKRICLENTCKNTSRTDYIKRAKELAEYIKQYKIDVMVYHAWMEPLLIWDMLLIKRMYVPFVLYTHGVFATIYHNRDKITEKWHNIYRRCDRIICLTRVSEKFYRMLGCRVNYIQNPVEDVLKSAPQAKLLEHNILWIGRFSEEKHPLDAILVFEKVFQHFPEAELYLVGEGNTYWNDKLRQSILSKEWKNKVHFCGYQEKVESFYLNASVMILTSDFEGYCLTLLESKAYGIPCVMYELPYLALTKDKKGIKEVPIGNKQAMADEVIHLLMDGKYRQKIGESARKSFEQIQNFDLALCWKDIFCQIEQGICNDMTQEDEKMMLQLLIDQSNIGIQKILAERDNRLEVKVGRKIIYWPKRINDFLWRITHR